MVRIAIIDKLRCINGTGCNFICGNYCPVNRTGSDCVVVDDNKRPIIDEGLCTGCGICPKRCPVDAIEIINLPEKLNEEPIHRYGKNAFELFRLPIPKFGKVVGILGRNGIGKTTALAILSGTLKPNLGNLQGATEEEIVSRYSKSFLGDYFKKLFANELYVSYKPQRIELLPKIYDGTVKELLNKIDEKGNSEELTKELGIFHLLDRKLSELSGGELQRLAIIATAVKKADIYYFDEPASFCDITTRIKVAKLIRKLVNENTAVMVVEHDLATLDYISDEIQIVYGIQNGYGVISQSKSVKRGINEYLDGFLPDDNVRFRNYSIKFEGYLARRTIGKEIIVRFPSFAKHFENFSMVGRSGEVHNAEIMAVMGANGLGKTTFLKILAGELKPDSGTVEEIKISYKPQYLDNTIQGTVKDLLMQVAEDRFNSGWYKSNIMDRLGLEKIQESQVSTLSGGELQKFYVALTLSRKAKLYAFDEPSAFVDVEDRLKVAEVIKDFVIKNDACAIVVDHDVQFIDYVGDSMLVFEGKPGKEGHVIGPLSKPEGMNKVLHMLDITYRLDQENLRPRINKPGSQLDRTQRDKNKYYYA
ncbi:MAG: ribosome biogenesis/translation initiation ATPase RLI [archaeon]